MADAHKSNNAVRDQSPRHVSGGKTRRGHKSLAMASRSRAGLTFVSPAMLVMVLLVVYPLLYGMYISLFKTNLLNRWDFVGLTYFVQALSDPGFLKSLIVTSLYALFAVAGHLIVGTALAVMLASGVRYQVVFRALLILPWLFPDVVVALIFRWIFDPIFGLFNFALITVGLLDTHFAWLDDPIWAFVAVVCATIWKGYPLIMLLVLAGLQSIPKDRYEAAALDGAGRFLQFRYVSLPGLVSVLGVAVIIDFIWWFKHFTIVWLLTKGGPIDATNVVSIDIYRTAFQSFNFGQASAMAVIVFFICLVFAVIYQLVVPADEA